MSKLKFTCILLLITGTVLSQAYADDRQKLQYIQNHFDQESRRSLLWQNGWLALVSANGAINAIATHQADTRAERVDTGTALLVSGLGMFSSIRDPMRIHEYSRKLNATPVTKGEDLTQRLAMAEDMLESAAKREADEQSASNRITSAVIHGAAGLLVSTKGSGEREGLVRFLGGMLFSELQIRTAPKKSIATWEHYQSGTIDTTHSANTPQLSFAFNGSMLSAMLRF